jgi:hypothetical protein
LLKILPILAIFYFPLLVLCETNNATGNQIAYTKEEKQRDAAELKKLQAENARLGAEKARLLRLIAEEEANEQSARVEAVRAPVSNSDSIYGEIDRIQSIRDPNQRANANANFVRGMLGNLDTLIKNNPQATGGMNPDEFTLESLYNSAREKGLPPSEAQIKAQRQFRNMKRFMNQSGYAHDSTGYSILIKQRRAFRHNHKMLCMVE